jgi:hypothetical protein
MEKLILEQNKTLTDALYQCADVVPEKMKKGLIAIIMSLQPVETMQKNERLKQVLKGCIPNIQDPLFCDAILGILDSMVIEPEGE